MKKKDIEKMLRNSADNFTPDIFYRIKERNIYTNTYQYKKYENSSEKTKNKFVWKKAFLAFSCVLVVVIGIMLFMNYMLSAEQTVYLDINPSMALTTNHFDNVIQTEYLNEDAETLFAEFDPKGKDIETVVAKFVDLCCEKGYINEENSSQTIFISAYAKNEQKAAKTLNSLNSVAEQKLNNKKIYCDVQNEKINQEIKEQAKIQNISPAKLMLIKKIILLDDNYTINELENKNMNTLNNILKNLVEEQSEKNQNKGNSDNNSNENTQGNSNTNYNENTQGNHSETATTDDNQNNNSNGNIQGNSDNTSNKNSKANK